MGNFIAWGYCITNHEVVVWLSWATIARPTVICVGQLFTMTRRAPAAAARPGAWSRPRGEAVRSIAGFAAVFVGAADLIGGILTMRRRP